MSAYSQRTQRRNIGGVGRHEGFSGKGTTMNEYEHAARVRKAKVYAEHMRNYGIISSDVDIIADAYWPKLAEAVGENPPSPLTIAEIKRQLYWMEQPKMTVEQLLARLPE